MKHISQIDTKLKNDIIAEMTLRRERNDNKRKNITLAYYIIVSLVVIAFLVMLSNNNQSINTLLSK